MTEVATARPSSTVVLVRSDAGTPQVLMVRRHANSAFGAAYAFPGGVLDADDARTHDRCSGRGNADALLSVDAGGLDYYVAAIRELFEETGILLADVDIDAATLEDCRQRLNDASLSWCEFASSHDLRMRAGDLVYFSHWITPDALPKRYTTRFFLAPLPDGQVATHNDRELTDAVWLSPADALRAGQDGTMKLYYPTVTTLESLADHRTVEEMLEWGKTCEANGVVTIHPSTVPPSGR